MINWADEDSREHSQSSYTTDSSLFLKQGNPTVRRAIKFLKGVTGDRERCRFNLTVNSIIHYFIPLKKQLNKKPQSTTHSQNLPDITQKLHNLIWLFFTKNTKHVIRAYVVCLNTRKQNKMKKYWVIIWQFLTWKFLQWYCNWKQNNYSQ